MPDYTYQGRDNEGRAVTGFRSAANAQELADRLQKENIIPISIEPATGRKYNVSFQFIAKLFQKVPSDELQMFCRQMHTLTKAGVPLTLGINRLSETTKNKYFSVVLQEVIVKLNEGKKLSATLANYPNIFSPLFVNIVSVGENTGRLDVVFLQLSNYLQLEQDTKKRIKAAMRYPLIVITVSLIAVLIINAFVVPAFAKMFENFKGELPLPTRILIATSNVMTGYWYVILGVAILLISSFIYFINTEKGKLIWHRFILKIPLVGWIIHRILLARFARLFSLILRSGISAYDGMSMLTASIGNAFIEKKLIVVTDSIARGQSIATAVARTNLFSSLIVQILTVGEETGSIEEMLLEVAAFYEREVEYDLSRLSDALEPILLIIMAVMVLILALGVFLPMWDMVNLVRKN